MHLCDKDRHYLRAKGWGKIFQTNGPKKQAGANILIVNKINYKQKLSKKKKQKKGYLSKENSTKVNS